jgi:hypothetical protein
VGQALECIPLQGPLPQAPMKQRLRYIALYFLVALHLACEKQQNRHIQVYGTVRDSLGNPVSTRVEIWTRKARTFPGVYLPVLSTETKQDGTYEINRQLPGNMVSPYLEILTGGISATGSAFRLAFMVEEDGRLFSTTMVPLEFGKPKKVDFVLK